MKKFLVLWILFVTTLPALSETIPFATRSTNRSGHFTMLKVSRRAIFRGGLDIDAGNSLDISSSNAVMYNQTTNNTYDVNKIEFAGTHSGTATVNMPNATFCGANGSECKLIDPDSPTPTPTYSTERLNIESPAGTLTFSAPSYIERFKGAGKGKAMIRTKEFMSQNEAACRTFGAGYKYCALNIEGNEGAHVTLYGSGSTRGLTLMGGEIPYPDGNSVMNCNSHHGINLNGDKCSLQWLGQTQVGTGLKFYVLGLNNCLLNP